MLPSGYDYTAFQREPFWMIVAASYTTEQRIALTAWADELERLAKYARGD